jgi:ferredoxin
MPKVHFLNEIVTVEAERGQTIKEVAVQHGIPLHRGLWTWANCRSHGLCGSCQVWVNPLGEGALGPKTFFERIRSRVSGTVRLGCQARVLGDVEVRTLPGGERSFHPAASTRWDPDPRPSRWKERLAAAEAGGDDDEDDAKAKPKPQAAPAKPAQAAAPAAIASPTPAAPVPVAAPTPATAAAGAPAAPAPASEPPKS